LISRQKLIGWTLIILCGFYIAYFVKVRVLTPGPLLEKKDWLQLVGSIVGLMIGTANVRLAAMREQRGKRGK